MYSRILEAVIYGCSAEQIMREFDITYAQLQEIIEGDNVESLYED